MQPGGRRPALDGFVRHNSASVASLLMVTEAVTAQAVNSPLCQSGPTWSRRVAAGPAAQAVMTVACARHGARQA